MVFSNGFTGSPFLRPVVGGGLVVRIGGRDLAIGPVAGSFDPSEGGGRLRLTVTAMANAESGIDLKVPEAALEARLTADGDATRAQGSLTIAEDGALTPRRP